MEKTYGWFCFSWGLCGNFWFVCVTSILLHHLMCSWHSAWLFHTPERARSCCEMKSLLVLLSHLCSFSHTHVHTNTHMGTKLYVLPAVSLSSHVLHAAFPYVQPPTGTPWADPPPALTWFWVVRPSGGLAPTGEKVLVVRTGPGRGGAAEGSRSVWRWSKILPVHQLVLDSPNTPSLFSHSAWGIVQVIHFFPPDFGSSQDIQKDADTCVFLGSMPPVMIEGFVWLLSFCWHYQQLLPLFDGTSVRQQWLCQII